MTILGIESSCDECSISIVEDGKKVLSEALFSQIDLHKPFSGVVPEISARNHVVTVLPLLEKVSMLFPLKNVDAFAASIGPGLIGSLIIGSMTARSLAYALKKPFIPVDHIEAHLYSPHLVNEIPFPHLALLCSGGHTLIVLVKSFVEYKILGTTIDDAVGEAFDKVAKMLDLGYPGGPIIDRISIDGNENFWDLPIGLSDDQKTDRYNFSYSGLKTAVFYKLRELDRDIPKADICASFQKSAITSLLRKLKNASVDSKIKTIIVVGGVAANSLLRKSLELWSKEGFEIYNTPLDLCGDNASMVAGRAYVNLNFGENKTSALTYARYPLIRKGQRL